MHILATYSSLFKSRSSNTSKSSSKIDQHPIYTFYLQIGMLYSQLLPYSRTETQWCGPLVKIEHATVAKPILRLYITIAVSD